MKKILLFIFVYSIRTVAQIPDPAFNPMTAPGAIGIDSNEHTLFWENPSGVQYNECYLSSDSSLVANMDTTVRIQNGYPSTVYNSVNITSLSQNTRYFWSVIEYNGSGNSSYPLWYFNTQPFPAFITEYQFDSDLEGWEIFGPLGFSNWYWGNSSNAGSSPGEMVFFWDPVFIGDSYMISPEIPCPAGATVMIDFHFYEDWWSDTVVVGCAITPDNGNTWTSIWELHATGNVGPDYFYTSISAPANFRLGFYYSGDSNNIDFLYVDNISVFTAITLSYPPSFLQAQASSTEQKVTLSWNAGVPLGQPMGYKIQRKNGLPEDDSTYIDLAETGASTLTLDDETVELNHNYTYRIATLSGSGILSHYGNEATAYVPDKITSVKTNSELLGLFFLDQNYPNPFNPSTKIKYTIPNVRTQRAVSVQLKVYDILGNEVVTLVNEELTSGEYEVEFDASSGSSFRLARNLPAGRQGLTSGVYFYQLIVYPANDGSVGFIQTKKMLLIK